MRVNSLIPQQLEQDIFDFDENFNREDHVQQPVLESANFESAVFGHCSWAPQEPL